MGDEPMSTRTCARCGATCHGCGDTDEPHLCSSCKAKQADGERKPCEHVEKFLDQVRSLYSKDHHFVTLDEPINAHCHVCSGIFKIPEGLMRGRAITRKKGEAELSICRRVTQSVIVSGKDSQTVKLDSPISIWSIVAESEIGVWEETYVTKAEKDAFVRGYRAASYMHKSYEPKIHEER